MLANPLSPDAVPEIRDVQLAAQANNLQLKMYNAGTRAELDAAFSAIAAQRPDVLIIGSDPFYVVRRDDFVAFAARYKIPAMYPFREFADAGGLISYGTNIANAYGQAGIYAGQILKEQSLRSFRSCGRPSLNWSSISGLRRPSALTFLRRCTFDPTM